MSVYIDNVQVEIDKNSKKPFNKKKWREQKYSCRAKVQKWDRFKKKEAQRYLKKECEKLQLGFQSKNGNTDYKRRQSFNSFKQAQLQYKVMQQMNEEKRKEQERIKKEKTEAIKAYKEMKAARFKKLSQKTKKGQPLMRGRIELLLEKIQRNYVYNEIC